MQTIEVIYDCKTDSLVAPDQFTLSGNEDLRWLFIGIPNDAHASVVFETVPFTGPFLSLCQAHNRVIGHGRQALEPSTHRYRLRVSRIVDDAPQTVQSPILSLSTENLTDRLPTVVEVIFEDGDLRVEPEAISLSSYDTVFWIFSGLPNDWYPEIRFTKGPKGLLNSSLGPFLSLTYHSKMLTGSASVSEIFVYGSGNNGYLGSYRYLIEIRDSYHQARQVKIVDPGLDNRGDPPGG